MYLMAQNSFKVGTFNVYNLSLAGVPYYDKKYSQAVYDQKIGWIGQQLDCMKADVVGFQEVWQQQALQDAIDQSEFLKDAKIVIAKEQTTTPSVAIASRFPILSHEVIETFPEAAQLEIEGEELSLKQFSRPVLCVRVQIREGLECTFVVAHLKSKRSDFSEGADPNDPLEQAKGQVRSLIRRSAEAVAMRSVLINLMKGTNHPVIAMGDLNDGSLAVTTRLISGEPPFRRLSIERKKSVWDVLLYHVKDIQARQSYGDFYYTHIYNGHHESLDHILVSQEFVEQNPNRVGRVGYVSVFNDHLVDETLSKDGVEPWQSDHGQVVASIELEKPRT
jgi:endonuclease/exonuclease/phosphatase family metal-dependent hydrolase